MAGRPIGNFPPPLIKRVVAHLLRRCRLVAGDHPRTTFATDVQAILQHALAVRDAHQAGEVSPHGLAVARGHLINRLAERLDRPSRVPDVQRFAAHLTREFTAIWSFLFDPTIDATNWRAEHAIRPAVVTRKVWGGNRTWRGRSRAADARQHHSDCPPTPPQPACRAGLDAARPSTARHARISGDDGKLTR
jgi:transposase